MRRRYTIRIRQFRPRGGWRVVGYVWSVREAVDGVEFDPGRPYTDYEWAVFDRRNRKVFQGVQVIQ
jgi:hypothetical protein